MYEFWYVRSTTVLTSREGVKCMLKGQRHASGLEDYVIDGGLSWT